MATLSRAFVAFPCLAVAACITLPAPPPEERTQQLSLRSDPDGAHCSIFQESVIVASVDTPGTAQIPRRNVPIEVVCKKEGYLVQRMQFQAFRRYQVEFAPTTTAPRVLGAVALLTLSMALHTSVFPPESEAGVQASFGYGRLPQFVLIPATFNSEAARDRFFEALTTKLEKVASEQRAYIDQRCRYWPCTPSDTSCPDPVCEQQRAIVDEQLKAQLDQIPALRAQVRIVAGSAASGDLRPESDPSDLWRQ